MNEKAVKLARVINRFAGTLVKRSYDEAPKPEVTAEDDVPAIVAKQAAAETKVPHKLPRKVKRWWASLDHKKKGRATKYWQQVADHSREARALEAEANP